MINAVGRDIPEEILEMTGKEVFQGNHYRDGYVYKKDGPYTKCVVNNTQSKLVANIHDVLIKCGIKDGMTLGFHHHFREGDYVVNRQEGVGSLFAVSGSCHGMERGTVFC